MKRAVSISLGSSKRDKSVTIKLKDQEILVERIGTDGDIAKARQLYLDLDGKIDAFALSAGVINAENLPTSVICFMVQCAR